MPIFTCWSAVVRDAPTDASYHAQYRALPGRGSRETTPRRHTRPTSRWCVQTPRLSAVACRLGPLRLTRCAVVGFCRLRHTEPHRPARTEWTPRNPSLALTQPAQNLSVLSVFSPRSKCLARPMPSPRCDHSCRPSVTSRTCQRTGSSHGRLSPTPLAPPRTRVRARRPQLRRRTPRRRLWRGSAPAAARQDPQSASPFLIALRSSPQPSPPLCIRREPGPQLSESAHQSS